MYTISTLFTSEAAKNVETRLQKTPPKKTKTRQNNETRLLATSVITVKGRSC